MSACTCPTWKENIDHLNGPIIREAVIRNIVYKGAEFTHCPWCGSSLEASNASPAKPEQSPTGNPPVTPGAVQGGLLEVDGAGLVDAFMDQVESFVKAEYTEDETARFKEKVMLAMRATLVNSFAALRSSPPGPARPDSDWCGWHEEDSDSYNWETSCGRAWNFIAGGPVENGVKFCLECGLPIKVTVYCHPCSEAGGADRAIYHLGPACPAEPPKVEGKAP